MTRFYEIKNCKQRPDEPARRWFSTSRQDLIVWFGDESEVVAFRFAYERNFETYSLTWEAGKGIRHDQVDLGRDVGRPAAPLLTPTGVSPAPNLIEQFTLQSSDLDPAIRDFVIAKLTELTSESA